MPHADPRYFTELCDATQELNVPPALLNLAYFSWQQAPLPLITGLSVDKPQSE
ncbi:hypothetical protein CPTB_01539 [Corynebacterium pseudotuberculosis]|nr:hypothetical protein CPTB_01539 [Corynebacterium pseudotuberculosis]AKC74385.1 Hypothetical protein Cp226_1680 [Corynebacterium pseudotuberculosis]